MNSKPLKILLADDDSDDCHFFKKALEDLLLPTQLTIVEDGEQLMNYLYRNYKNLPDILFLDLSMPRKSGLECLSEIKRDEKLKHLSLVMLSTSNSKDTINNVFRIGARVYIHKPGDFAQLKLIIHDALMEISDKQNLAPAKKEINY